MNFFSLVFVITMSLTILTSFTLTYYDSEKTKIKNIKITQNIDKTDFDLNEKIKNLIKNKSIFEIDKIELEKEIKNLSKEIKTANLLIYPPDTVYINLTYNEPIIKLFIENKYILYDENLNEVKLYTKKSFDEAITVIVKKPIKKEFLKDLVTSLQNTDKSIKNSKYFPQIFIFDENGIYGFNSTFKINVYFGFSIDETKIRKAFLSTKYIIQKKLPVRYIDARFDNITAN